VEQDEPQVKYTVREMFDRIDGRLDRIDGRLETLETARQRQSAITTLGGRAWVAAIAVLGLVVNIPAMMFYLGGGGTGRMIRTSSLFPITRGALVGVIVALVVALAAIALGWKRLRVGREGGAVRRAVCTLADAPGSNSSRSSSCSRRSRLGPRRARRSTRRPGMRARSRPTPTRRGSTPSCSPAIAISRAAARSPARARGGVIVLHDLYIADLVLVALASLRVILGR
jgi:hypothetical protein